MERWKRAGEGLVDFAPSQSGAGEPYGFRSGEALGSVRLVEENGEVLAGAAAVFRMMALCKNSAGRVAWTLYKKSNLFRGIADWVYARIAERRAALSKLSCGISRSQSPPEKS